MYRIKIAFDEFLRERNVFGNILLEAISLVVIGAIMFIAEMNNYNKTISESTLKNKMDQVGIMNIVDNNQYALYETKDEYKAYIEEQWKQYRTFKSEINQCESITDSVACNWGSMDVNSWMNDQGEIVFGESFEIAKKYSDDYVLFDEEDLGAYIECFFAEENYDSIFDIDVDSKYANEELEKLLKKYDGLIYVGNGLENIPEGTLVKNNKGEEYVIVGMVCANQKLPQINQISSQVMAYKEMNYRMLIVSSKMIETDTVCFNIKKGYDVNDARKELQEKSNKMKYEVRVTNFENIYLDVANSNSSLTLFIKKILTVVVITMILLHVCMQTVHIVENFGNYGVLYSNGFSKLDHYLMFFVQNCIKGLAACILAICAGYVILLVYYTNELSAASIDVLKNVVLKQVLWKIILCSFVIAEITTTVAYFIFRKKTPAALIKEKMN